jgi:FMN-dependent NADH-azoreductase
MARLLYVQASPRCSRSKAIQVADAFVEAYKAKHPSDTVEVFNVFTADLPAFDGDAVQGKYNIMHGKLHSAREKHVWDGVLKVIDHFKSADKYLFAIPMWNFGIPYRLKQYIDVVVQPGQTFAVTDKGYEGLVKGKPVAVVYARGGTYTGPAESYDQQKRYVEQILGFIGFTAIESIVVEPTLHGTPEAIEVMVEQRRRDARRLAETF